MGVFDRYTCNLVVQPGFEAASLVHGHSFVVLLLGSAGGLRRDVILNPLPAVSAGLGSSAVAAPGIKDQAGLIVPEASVLQPDFEVMEAVAVVP